MIMDMNKCSATKIFKDKFIEICEVGKHMLKKSIAVWYFKTLLGILLK